MLICLERWSQATTGSIITENRKERTAQMARIIQYQSILTGEWRDLVRLYPEADEDKWLKLYRRKFHNVRVHYEIGRAA